MGWKLSTHNGAVTMVSPKTGDHRTVRISTQPDDARFAPGKRVARLLVGTHDEWVGFGFVVNGQVKVWSSKRGTKFEKYADMLNRIGHYRNLGVEYMVEGSCRKCNRALTNPVSIESGIGPICAQKEA